MMMGLGVGGVSVGMFHLITHAFFKACSSSAPAPSSTAAPASRTSAAWAACASIMPVTFPTYAVGMLALCGFPFFFSGFWSKDAILHAAHDWSISQAPFYIGALGALLTAFYMTRQVYYVFFGSNRLAASSHDDPQLAAALRGTQHTTPRTTRTRAPRS